MKIVRPAVRAFAVGEESRPSAFLFNDGNRTSFFEFKQQLELDELSLLVAGRLDTPTSTRLCNFIVENFDLFEDVDEQNASAFSQSPLSRQLSYFACLGGVNAAMCCLKQLEQACVWIVGVGGIGCHLADHLVRIGVRKFVLIDYDTVETSNLNRQILYQANDVGRAKTEAAASRLQEIGHHPLDIKCHDHFDPETLSEQCADLPAIIFVSADVTPFELRRQVISRAFLLGVPYAFIGYTGENAAISPIVLDRSGGCGSCATVGGNPEKWLWPLARHKALDTPPSSYATNAIVSALAVDLWTRHLMGEVGGALEFSVSMRDFTVRRRVSSRDPTCPVCAAYHEK